MELNYKEFIENAKRGKLKPVYLIYGEEDYLIDYSLKTVQNMFIDKALEHVNCTRLVGKEIGFETIFNACETLPFMSKKKFVIVKDFPLFKNKRDEATASGDWVLPPSKSPIVKYIGKLGSHLCLIFVEKETTIRKTNALFKAIRKYGNPVECTKLRGVELDNWIRKAFKSNNIRISKSNISYFIRQSSYFDSKHNRTLYDLENEIAKISNYLAIGQEANKEIIDFLMAKPLDMNVFNLLNSIGQKNASRATRLLNEMYLANEPMLFILHMIVRQLRNMLKYILLKQKYPLEQDVYRGMALSKYEYEKISKQSSNFSTSQLERALSYCLETDKYIKLNHVEDRIALEILITNLCHNI